MAWNSDTMSSDYDKTKAVLSATISSLQDNVKLSLYSIQYYSVKQCAADNHPYVRTSDALNVHKHM